MSEMKHYVDNLGKYIGSFDEASPKPEGTLVPTPPHGLAIWNGTAWDMSQVIQGQQEVKRQAAYNKEADPLFFKWQAGEATEAEWLAKRQEIRDRYPYPAETQA